MRTAATSSPSVVSLWRWDVDVNRGLEHPLHLGLSLPGAGAAVRVVPGSTLQLWGVVLGLGRCLVPEAELFWQRSESPGPSLWA